MKTLPEELPGLEINNDTDCSKAVRILAYEANLQGECCLNALTSALETLKPIPFDPRAGLLGDLFNRVVSYRQGRHG